MCCEPIGESYLREIATSLSYCDRGCYLGRAMMRTVPALQYRASASPAAPPPAQAASLTLDGMR
jgi:hypothetical protein